MTIAMASGSAVAVVAAAGIFATCVWGVLRARDVLRVLIGLAAGAHAIILLAWAVEVTEIAIAIALFIALSRRGLIEISRMREGKW